MNIVWQYSYTDFGTRQLVRWTAVVGTWTLCVAAPHSDAKVWEITASNSKTDSQLVETFNGSVHAATKRAVALVLETMSPWAEIARAEGAASAFEQCIEIAVAEQREAKRMRGHGDFGDDLMWRGYDRAAKSIEHAIRSRKGGGT